METKQYVWRGTYGDTEPVRVHMTQALDFYGGLEAEHFESEEAAWAAILGAAKESEEHAEKRYRKIESALDAATDEMVQRRATMRTITRNYEEWRCRAPKVAAV